MSTLNVDSISNTDGTGAPTFPNGLNLDSITITHAVTAETLDLGAWTIVQVGDDLIFKYNSTSMLKLSSLGALTAEGDVAAFGDP